MISKLEDSESRAAGRSTKGNTHIKNAVNTLSDVVSTLKSEIASNRVKIESEAGHFCRTH